MKIERVREAVAAHRARAMTLPADHSFREASVLVPIVAADPVRVILTVRPETMRTHSGQIAFPGGRRDAEDADAIACALREAEEELGIPRDAVEVAGELDQFATPSGYVVSPVVGIVRPGLTLCPHPGEVAEVFELTLEALATPGVFAELHEREFLGVRQRLCEFNIESRRIWGITARVIHQLLTLLR